MKILKILTTIVFAALINTTISANEIKMGNPEDFSNFMNAVIDKPAFDSISKFIDFANDSSDAQILTGGKYNEEKGYFIEPTTILTSDPKFRTMCEEIFGPVLTIFLYDPSKWNETLKLVDSTSEYALTGCVISEDKKALIKFFGILSIGIKILSSR